MPHILNFFVSCSCTPCVNRYLRPIITFPVMFLIVGSAFYVAILSGAVTVERDAASLDNNINDMVAFLGAATTESLTA